MPVEITTIGASGQISLGKQYAGSTDGVKTARIIRDDEIWLRAPETQVALDRALDWSAAHPRSETDRKVLARKLNRK